MSQGDVRSKEVRVHSLVHRTLSRSRENTKGNTMQNSREPSSMQHTSATPPGIPSKRESVRKTPVESRVLYYAPDDPRLLVPRTGFGRGAVVNYGHPQSWRVLAFMGVVVAGLTVLGSFLRSTAVLFFLVCIWLLVVWLVLVGYVVRLRISERKTSRHDANQHHEKRG